MADMPAISPEKFDIATAYILNSGSADETSKALGIPLSVIIDTIQDKQVQLYLNEIYLDQGYRNKRKLGMLIDTVIDAKLGEALETGIYSNKDLAEWVKLAMQMRESDIKANAGNGPTTTVQVNNFGENLSKLMDQLVPNNIAPNRGM